MNQPWGARTRDAGWLLLPLRAFLAVVFLDGGISKIADPRFLDGASPLSMRASVAAIRDSSPIGGLLGVVQDHSFGFGILMAAGELAVGLGLLLGLFTRVAAAGGMLLALSLWLTVSWGATPWFTSADLVYLFALTPLLIAGARVYSLDGWLDHAREVHPGAGEDRTRRTLIGGGVGILGAIVLGSSALFRPSHRSRRQKQLDTASPPQTLTPAKDAM
jgi:thiosulfate dehydrogenase (quinone) large subunit